MTAKEKFHRGQKIQLTEAGRLKFTSVYQQPMYVFGFCRNPLMFRLRRWPDRGSYFTGHMDDWKPTPNE